MKKFSWNKFLNISLIAVAALIVGCILGMAYFYRPLSKVAAAPLVEGIPFKAGIMDRASTSFDVATGRFNYSDESTYNGNLETIYDADYVMLYNYRAEKELKTGTGNIVNVKNLYLSFGALNETKYITYLRVFAKLNGETINVNNTIEYDNPNLPNNIEKAYYWYEYFDVKNFNDLNNNKTGEGLYEFQFDYSYIDDNNKLITGQTYNFSFYLLDQSKYDTYPKFNNTNNGNLDTTNIKQFYYNYTNTNLASLTFDASRYNITFTREKNKDTETVETSFSVNPNNSLGTLTLRKTLLGTTTTELIENIPFTDDAYNTTIYLDDLGTYNFTIKYLLKIGSNVTTEYKVIENIMAYDVANEDDAEDYENGRIQKGKLKLHIFGVKAFFTKDNGTELKQKNGGVVQTQADVTSKLYDGGNANPYNKFAHGFKKTHLSDTNIYPVTNLAPVFFDYYCTFSFNGNQPLSTYRIYSDNTFNTVKSSGYVTKDSNLNDSGYYEIVINYKFDRYTTESIDQTAGAQIPHSQAFIFQIDNSTPTIELFKGVEQTADAVIKNNAFVNAGVTAKWNDTNYFQAPITASYLQYDYNGGAISSGQYSRGSIIGNGGNGKYYLRIYFTYSSDVYVEYSFTVDSTEISDINIQPIKATIDQEDGTVSGYRLEDDTNVVNFNNSSIINQPFTLTYSQKASGAKITTTYYKIPYAYNNNTGNIKTLNNKQIIETDFVIDPSNMSSGIEYNLNFNTTATGSVSAENAFLEDKSYIYLFEIKDEAGNQAEKYIIYDLSKPYIIVDADAQTLEIDPIDNPYGIVTKEAKLTWGDFKGVRIDALVQSQLINNVKLQSIINSETELFKLIDESYYLCVPIKKFSATEKSNALNLQSTTFRNSVNIYPSEPNNATEIQKFFSGDDKTYKYLVTDASHITSSTNLAKSNIRSNFIRMFLDNAQGIAYGFFGDNPTNNSFIGYDDILSGTTSAKQLRFTYLPGAENSDYHVKSLTYSFYDFAPESYVTVDTTLNEQTQETYLNAYQTSINNGVPYPTYPFSKTATISNRTIALTNLKVDGSQIDRVVTEILNPVSGSGAIVSKPGMYVIRREYEAKEGVDYTYDSVVRYYVYYVDRNGIIEIDSSIEDANIYQTTRSQMLYETGSGIIFNFSNPSTNGTYNTYYTALQIQQYLAFASSTIFDSNKLPINFFLPLDKYNSKISLNQATDGLNNSGYINSISTSNNFNFGLRYSITLTDNGNIVFDNTGDELKITTSYVTISENNGFRGLRFVKAGQYSVALYDSSDNRTTQLNSNNNPDIKKQYNNKYNFNFKISHESPNGEYLSKYDDDNRTDMLLTAKSTSTNNITFNSLNNDSLRFRFRKSDDKYRAEVDPNAILVQRKIGTSVTNIYGGGAATPTNVLKFIPDGNDPQTGEATTTGYYVLTIFDEQEYLQNGTAYIGGSGNNRDYLLSKTQNIEYIITLQYIGVENDYIVNSPEDGTVNFFKRTFNITLDRIKPQFNYQSLVNLDNQKFAASSSLDSSRMDKYFFAVNKNFTFIQNANLGGVLDSTKLFLRKLDAKPNGGDYPDYYKTFTPDDDNYYEEGNTNHIRFSESNDNFVAYSYKADGTLPLMEKSATGEEYYLLGDNAGYYEVVERDEAGNYKVYAIYYNPQSISNVINYSYEPALETDPSNGSGVMPYDTVAGQQRTVEILGNRLQFTTINDLGDFNNDYFYKCIISYGTTTKTIINNPNDRTNSDSWTEFLTLINNELLFTDVITKEGYKITITFVNRLSENYVFTYRVPGDRLEPIFTDISATEFSITIPNDNNSTYIKEFHVWKFVNGIWVEQSQDGYGNTIVKSYSTGASLAGKSYRFGLGEYKFQLIDIFGRGANLEQYPPYYKGVGVNDVRRIIYDTNINVNGIEHTAKNVTLSYQTNLYILTVFESSNGEDFHALDESVFVNGGITEQSLIEGVRTLIFENKTKDTIKFFRVELVVEKTQTKYTYTFAINKTLPEIVLRNLSGGKLITSSNSNEPTIHTENFVITWDANDAFGSRVDLNRVYIDAAGKQQTEIISNIPNGYEVSMPGTYTASIHNNLNYSDSKYNIYFKLVSGEIVVYDIVAINNGVEKILQPSPKTSTIMINDVTKILYRYYALTSFNQPQGSNKYIELRANKNKGIEYELVSTTEQPPEEEQAGENRTKLLIKKVYRIYGASNYGYERYIEIIFVDELTTENSDFTGLTASYPTDETGLTNNLVLTSGDVKTNVESVTLKWKAYNLGPDNQLDLRGNLIYLDYYFNGNFIRTIYSDSLEFNTLTITNAGIHKFKLYDLAGNQQLFGISNELVINLINNVLFTINGAEPINNRIFNGDVLLEITNRYLYFSDPTISATLNGKEFTPEKVGTSFYQYKFSSHGYYEITISTRITQNEYITTKHCFTILNQNIALPCFSVPQNSNFHIVKVLKQNSDITHTLESLNELWISPASLGVGNYTITLSQFNNALNSNVEFTFQVWINNEVPYIYSSTTFGTSTTKNITITFNPKIIYDQVGESYIAITGEPSININAASPNAISSYTLSKNREYWIQIYSADNKLITSYKITKNEPLNTTAIIIIVVVSVIVVALIIVFIVIRRHLKFR